MNNKGWWVDYPWRMVQTNLREIDMENMDAAAYAKELKEYQATVVTLNAAGILASYETKLDFQNQSAYLNGDTLKQMIEECHKAGIRVIARCDFSKISYEMYLKHPDWAYRRADGEIVNYNGFVQTCVNSEYQQKYVFEILKELFREHDFDGVFCNMSGFMIVDYDYNYHGPCHCENCKRLFNKWFAGDIPEKDDMRNPMYGKYVAFKNKSTKEQRKKLYECVKGINENLAINGFDYQRIECNQDMDRPTWIYQASANARRISGIEKINICDDASTDFMGFRYRHSSISPALMEIRQWQNLAYSGSTSLYVMGTLGNHKDRTGINASKKAFKFFAEHEDIFAGLHSKAEVLLVNKPLLGRVDAEVSGWIRALSESHIPFDELKLAEVTKEILESKKLVILADTRFISDETAQMFDDYVAAGGRLLATGETGCNEINYRPRTENALRSLGVSTILEKRNGLRSSIYEIHTSDECVLKECAEKEEGYIVPGSEVVISEIIDHEKTEKFLKLIPEQLYGPPEICYPKEKSEIPGILRTSFGKGTGIYIPFMVGTLYYEQGYDNTFTFMKDVLFHVCGVQSISKNCTPMCEITVLGNADKKIVQLINTTGCFTNSYFEPVPIHDIELDIDVNKRKVSALNGGKVTIVNNKIVLDCLHTYEAVLIENI